MRFKLPGKVIGLVLIGIMFISTFAFSVMEATFYGTQPIKLPENRILEHILTREQKNLILNYGGTIATILYSPNCSSCIEQKDFLESLVKKYNWLYLEKISGDYDKPTVYIVGIYGQRTLENRTNEEVFSALCDVAYQPPIECALREVK